MLAYAKSYAKYADENGKVRGAYGPRLMGQLYDCVQMLKRDRRSRQAVVAIWNKHDVEDANGGQSHVPCTLSLQFLLRDEQLHCVGTMRSNDAWLGFPYDVFAFTCVQRLVASALDASVGWYKHQVGSMHAYERDWTQCVEALRWFRADVRPPLNNRLDWLSHPAVADEFAAISEATSLESLGRMHSDASEGLCTTREKYEESCGVMLADLAFATWQKNRPGVMPLPRARCLWKQYS
jgi:hypothetical protein